MGYKKVNKELSEFCEQHEIQKIGAEYFFYIKDIKYKVTRFKVEESKIKDVTLPRLMSSRTRPKVAIPIYGMAKDVIRIYTALTNGEELNFTTGLPPGVKPPEKTARKKLSKAKTEQPVVEAPRSIPPENLSEAKKVIRPSKVNNTKKTDALNQLLKRR